MTERKWLTVCAAFALGEALASFAPNFAEAWPFAVMAALVVGIWGFSLALSGWKTVCIFLLGVAVFLGSAMEKEQLFRDRPWMRKVSLQRSGQGHRMPALAVKLRRDLSKRMGIGLAHSPEIADMNRAILLGERYRLRSETKKAFVQSGTVHVFAISGLHVMVIANLFVVFSALIMVPYRIRALVAAPPLWLYVWIIGFPPSAVRAALMASIYLAAPMFWRRPNAVVSWAATFMIMHIAKPELIAEVGSQLSFTVMLALIIAARRVREWTGLKQRIAIAFAAWAAGVPIVASQFGTLTPGGLVANLALVPTAGVAVVTCVSGVVSSWVCESLSVYINNLAALVTSAMAGFSAVVAVIPGANFEIRSWGVWESLVWYGVLLSLPYLFDKIGTKKLF
jgi:ComEC/Rec2-related protein